MIGAEDRVIVGVSGGADSVALLMVLIELGYRVAVAHLNHGLRGKDSDEDQEFVANLTQKLRVSFFPRQIRIDPDSNVEMAGRAARRAFFDSLCSEHGFTRTALAHNRDDRVETFLLNLLRGSGLEGMVSMGPASGRIVRPLIESSRREIVEYLKGNGLAWRVDQSNFDMSFSRNRIRHEILPRLTSLFNARLPETLARTVTLLQDEDEYLHGVAEEWLAKVSRRDDSQGVAISLEVPFLQQLPAAIVRRVIRLALKRAELSLQDVTFEHIESVRTLLGDGKSGKTVQLPGGAAARREFGQLWIGQQPAPSRTFSYELRIPGSVYVPELGQTFRAEVLSVATPAEDQNRVFVDGARLGDRVRVRNWNPGDYYRPQGWPGGKVKKLFQRARVPRSRRGRWAVVEANSAIVWVASFPVSREFAAGQNAEKIVAFEALQG